MLLFYNARFSFILILSCMTLINALPAQSTLSDSLFQEISKAKKDTSRFRLINQFALALNQQDPDSAYQILKSIIPEAEKRGHLPSLLELYYTKGLVYAKRAQYDSTLLTMEKAKGIALEINDQVNLVHILDQTGHAYFYKNQTTLGINYLKEALTLAKRTGDKNVVFKERANLGRLYTMTEKYDSADIFINRALQVQEELGNKRFQAEILTNLGLTAFRAQQLEKGFRYFERSLQLMKEINDDQGLGTVYSTLGYCYYNSGDLPNALENYHHAQEIFEGTRFYQEAIRNYESLAEAYLSSEDFENALLYSQKAIEAWEVGYGNQENADLLYKNGRILLLTGKAAEALQKIRKSLQLKAVMGQMISGNYYMNMGQCFEQLAQLDSASFYYQKGLENSAGAGIVLLESQCLNGLGRISEQQNNPAQALKYYQTAYDKANAGGYKAKKMEAAEGQYRIYKQQNDVLQALQFLETARTIQDSLFNEENTREITRIQANFEFEKEKRELAFAQEKKNERQGNIRRLLWLALIVVSLFLIAGFFYLRVKQKASAELKKLNEELVGQKGIVEKQKERLEELDKAKSTFFTNISHELRTPLTVISGLTQRLKSNPSELPEQNYDIILRNSNNLLNLVNQILDLRKLESGKLEIDYIQADIIPFLQYIFESFESLAQAKDIQAHLLIEKKPLVMDYDSKKLLRILSNLLSNSIKFTPKGGHVYFIVTPPQDTAEAEGTSRLLSIKVKDTGVGIPPEKLPYIFERFYQVDDSSTRKGEGTGIGLALSKELATLLGGTIQVQSKENEGSEFTVTLPVTNEAPFDEDRKQDALSEGELEWVGANLGLAATPVELIDSNKDRPIVLLVEDNPDVLHYLIACLENQYALITAQDGQDGIEKAIEHVPDAIISDVMMPHKDGFEMCYALKNDERTSHVPILLLTAKADTESRLSGLRRGADDYLIKPFNEEELLTRLENQIAIRRKLQSYFQNIQPLPVEMQKAVQQEEIQQEHAFLQKIRKNLEANIDQSDYGILQICKAIHLSRTQLHRKIKALTGLSTSHYLRKIRLQRAKELLETTDLNVSQVAYEVGFRYPNHFSTAYIEEFGIRPSETNK